MVRFRASRGEPAVVRSQPGLDVDLGVRVKHCKKSAFAGPGRVKGQRVCPPVAAVFCVAKVVSPAVRLMVLRLRAAAAAPCSMAGVFSAFGPF